MARILIPLPDHDFDVTEVAVPWRHLSNAGHELVFATQVEGTIPAADPLLLSGVIFGELGAEDEPKRFYQEMTASSEFARTIAWDAIEPESFDGLLLAGGHAQECGSTSDQRYCSRRSQSLGVEASGCRNLPWRDRIGALAARWKVAAP